MMKHRIAPGRGKDCSRSKQYVLQDEARKINKLLKVLQDEVRVQKKKKNNPRIKIFLS